LEKFEHKKALKNNELRAFANFCRENGRKQREIGSKVPRQASYSKTTSGPWGTMPL